ncbi:MAG: hypothetical protein AAF805_09765 [Planctomycetota bacterium]
MTTIRPTTSLLTVALAVAVSAPAAAQNLGQIHWYTSQIHAQAATVRAQAEAALLGCPHAEPFAGDVFDELEDLCRRLDRLDEAAAQPIVTRGQLRRIERAVLRIDREACEVDDAVQLAIEQARVRATRFAPAPIAPAPIVTAPIGPAPLPVQPVGLGPTLANRGVSVSFGFGGVQVRTASFGRSDFAHGGFGGPNVGLSRRQAHLVRALEARNAAIARRNAILATRHGALHRTAHLVGHRHHVGRPLLVNQAAGWGREPAAAALCDETARLRRMTSQLVEIVTGGCP